ncbi:hypothetical protein RHMOL_Rhmol07G0193200 [Rhododendron molle]|uniref:Uncharacterized protein n=1 Tax=Rhododendron molle TaxID=49168 RepID=A0ACC0N416_RHOML|nr:hypothetical protein RHMOL_Rhmol07G0193200 [Rhododendron molle]
MAPKKIRKKIKNFSTQVLQLLEDEETPIHAEVLIPQTVAKSGMALGPAFDDRVSEAKAQLWKSIGIYDNIMLSRSPINMDSALFFAAAQFWSTTTNSFHFKVGMMGPMMQDISFLTGLRAHGIEANCFLSQKTPVFEYPASEFLAYTRFISYSHGEGDVTEEEHVAFLLYWLNKFLFCVSSSRITKDFTDLAKALASGQKLAMAPLVLAYLYRAMLDLLENRYVFVAGPLWIMTLWLCAYFPSLGPNPVKSPEHTCYDHHFRDLAPRDHTFEACFRYNYANLVSMGTGWMPFERNTVPIWLKTNPAEFEEYDDEQKEIWANYLISRDLLYGLSAQSKNEKSGVEFYNAVQFARQFSLLQLIPLPPYTSLNPNFTQRLILELKSLKKVKDDFDKANANFELHVKLKASTSQVLASRRQSSSNYQPAPSLSYLKKRHPTRLQKMAWVPPHISKLASKTSPTDGLDSTPITSIPSSSFARIGEKGTALHEYNHQQTVDDIRVAAKVLSKWLNKDDGTELDRRAPLDSWRAPIKPGPEVDD